MNANDPPGDVPALPGRTWQGLRPRAGGDVGGGSGASAAADLMRLLADWTRLRILLVLGHGEANVSDLCRRLDLPQPTASHHLGILRMSKVVLARRDGKQVFYRLSEPPPVPGTVHAAAGGASVTVTFEPGH